MASIYQARQYKGFTLIELSIVLVIIGLIIGGILVGKDMIRAAELRSVLSQIDNFQSAINAFRLKYSCLPGDCPNATDFFGTDSSGCPSGGGATGTCNGNDNRQIGLFSVGTISEGESFRSWQQLGLAGLIEGSYTGVAGPGGVRDVIGGTNAPISKMNKSAFQLVYIQSTLGDRYSAVSGHHILFFGNDSTNFEPDKGALGADEAYALDAKTDDGLPGSGRMIAAYQFLNNGYPECVTNNSAAYNIANKDLVCAINYVLSDF